MIRTLAAAIPDHPEVGRVSLVVGEYSATLDLLAATSKHQPGARVLVAPRASDIEEDSVPSASLFPDLSTMLTCDRAEEVGEMVGATHVCPECSALSGRKSFCHCGESGKYSGPESIPVTARIFLWTGEKVEWRFAEPCGCLKNGEPYNRCRKCHSSGWVKDNWGAGPNSPPLTAVVLVVPPIHSDTRYRDARQACADAGVQLIIPGDPERGRLEL